MKFIIKTILKLIICTIGTVFVLFFSMFGFEKPDVEYVSTGELTPMEFAQKNMIDQFNNYKEGEEFNFTMEEDILNVLLQDVTNSSLETEGATVDIAGVDMGALEVDSYVVMEKDLVNFNLSFAVEKFNASVKVSSGLKFIETPKSDSNLGTYELGMEYIRISNLHLLGKDSILSAVSGALSGESGSDSQYVSFESGNLIIDKSKLVNHFKLEEDTALYGTILEIFWENELAAMSVEEKNFSIAFELDKILIDKDFSAPGYLEDIGEDLTMDSVMATQLQAYLFSKVVDPTANLNFSEASLNKILHTEMAGFEDLGTEVEGEKIGVSNLWINFTPTSMKFNVLISIGQQKSLIEFEYSKLEVQPGNGDLELGFSKASIGDSSNEDKSIVLSEEFISSLMDMVGENLLIARITESGSMLIEMSKFEEMLASDSAEGETSPITVTGIDLIEGNLSLVTVTNDDMDNSIEDIKKELGNINSDISNSDKFSDEFKEVFDKFVDDTGNPVASELDNVTEAMEDFTEEERLELERIFGDLNIEF